MAPLLPDITWRFYFWSHPEWWAVLLSVAGWIFFFVGAAHFGMSASSMSDLASCSQQHGLVEFSTQWGVMIIAMMIPLLTGHMRVVASRSFWSRRHRAIAAFLAGYMALWLIFGIVVHLIRAILAISLPQSSRWEDAFLLVLAAIWQLTPGKRLGLAACHRTIPLAPHGIRADLDCFRYGFGVASACCLSCWALMMACDSGENMLWTMLLVTGIIWTERFRGRLSLSLSSFVLGSSALIPFLPLATLQLLHILALR